MDGQSDQQLIAQERDAEITLSPAHLYYRNQLATAAEGTDEHRIHQAINNAQFFINQSPNREKPSLSEKVPGSMMMDLAIHGVVLPPPIQLELLVWIGLPVLKYVTKCFQNWLKCWSYLWCWMAICFIPADLIILSQYFVELWDFLLLAHKSLESMTTYCVWLTVNHGKFKMISIYRFYMHTNVTLVK